MVLSLIVSLPPQMARYLGQSIRQLADGVMELPLEEAVKEKWLYHNAAALFGVA